MIFKNLDVWWDRLVEASIRRGLAVGWIWIGLDKIISGCRQTSPPLISHWNSLVPAINGEVDPNFVFDPHIRWAMIPLVLWLKLIRKVLYCMGDQSLFIVKRTIPSKAVKIYHAPLTRCGCEDVFIAGNWTAWVFNQWSSNNCLGWFYF